VPELPRIVVPLDLGHRAPPDGQAGARVVVGATLAAVGREGARTPPQATGEPGEAGELREIEVAGSMEAVLDLFESRRWTDGLPIVPPTPERVTAMVAASRRRADEVLALLPPGHGAATVEKIAINAVMAGCRPEYMPVLLAAVEAMADPVFNLNAVQGSTNPVAPLLIVNGPARHQLRFNSGYGCFGPGWRANATVGRAIRLILINVGGALPGEKDMAVAGQPGKYTFCVAENEEESPWAPLHVERGFARDTSVVTVVGVSSMINSLRASPEELAEAATFRGSNDYRFGGCPLFALNPLAARRQAEAGLDKPTLKRRIWELSRKRVGDFPRSLLTPREDELGSLDDPETIVTIARRPEDLLVMVAGAGGAGGHSIVMPSFGNTTPVSREIA